MISVQTDRLELLHEALKSNCDSIRFGSEFCDVKIPSLQSLKEAYKMTSDEGKSFCYVSPRVSNSNIKKIQEQIKYLAEDLNEIVVNDLGSLKIALQYHSMRIHWGRQLAYVPARCPWNKAPIGTGFIEKWRLKKIMSESSLDLPFMTQYLHSVGVKDLEIDCIVESVLLAKSLVENGFTIHVHLDGVPVTVTRKCHTARFMGEYDPERCSRPCDRRSFVLKQETIGVTLILYGNVVYRAITPDVKMIANLRKIGVTNYIIAMNPMTTLLDRTAINKFIADLGLKV